MYAPVILRSSSHFMMMTPMAITCCSAGPMPAEVESNFAFFHRYDATSIVQKWKVPIGSVLENTLEFQAYVRALIMLSTSSSSIKAGADDDDDLTRYLPPKPSVVYGEHAAPSEPPPVPEHDHHNHQDRDVVVPINNGSLPPPPPLLGVLVSSDIDAFVVSLSEPRRQCDLLMCLWRTHNRHDDAGDSEPFRRRRKIRELRVWLWDRGYGCTPHLHGEELQHWFLSREQW